MHIRGTDKWGKQEIDLGMYFKEIESYMRLNEGAGVFLATDDQAYLQEMIERFGDKVIQENWPWEITKS